ncbi:zinc finger protein OZF-like [Spodoptera litura]|uniref:Zinc finger protein OZF-like n=1 Tax=Spodoptera litura TaxID=69820 RepID=A0A9J7DVB2_SPOLT|nr:zinc finger protein OZF-like [Spodoptera litura]
MQAQSDDDHCTDTLADTPEPDLKHDKASDDDDQPLKRPATPHIEETDRFVEIHVPPLDSDKPQAPAPKAKVAPSLAMMQRQKLPMEKVQQIMRERDSSYVTETNILTIVEYSFVCPFKCRHNHLLCYYCGELYSDPELLRQHTLNTHNPKRFKVTEHKKMVKIDLTRIDCRLCGIKINDLDSFKKHISEIHKKKYYFNYKDSVLPFKLSRDEMKCAICNVLFPYFHALNKHMNEHYSNYVCETCGLGFVDRGRFVMHQQRHEEGDFPCPDCGKAFKALYNRDLHIDRVHRKKGRVYCPKCDVKLMSYYQKLKHLVEVHGEEPLSFPCTMCERIFETRRTLTIHRRKEHLKDYRYECQCCGQKFFTRFALNNHMPTHTGERNFKCKVCEKCYPRLKTLKDHMRIHTNDRRYRCHVCGQAFIQNCSLKGHMKSQHPEYEMR